MVTKFWEPIYRSNNLAKKTFHPWEFFCPAPRAPKVYSIDSSWIDLKSQFFILKIMLRNPKIFSKKVKNRGIFGTKKILLQKCVNFQIQSLAIKKVPSLTFAESSILCIRLALSRKLRVQNFWKSFAKNLWIFGKDFSQNFTDDYPQIFEFFFKNSKKIFKNF